MAKTRDDYTSWAVRRALHTTAPHDDIPLHLLLIVPRDAFREQIKTFASRTGGYIYVIQFRVRRRQRATAFYAGWRGPDGSAERTGTLDDMRAWLRACAKQHGTWTEANSCQETLVYDIGEKP